jgi:16S rRNA U516 pseudouridylate synthase RsuA-like enzyme
LAYSLLYTSAAILGPPKYSTFSARTPAATSHKKQTMSIIQLDVRSTGLLFMNTKGTLTKTLPA